jgi:HD-GYP domain-containing protein (c-di-GMP phosphodiesterase class II)
VTYELFGALLLKWVVRGPDARSVSFQPQPLGRDAEQRAATVVAQLERMRPATHAHSQRVATLATRVARHARLSAPMVGEIYWGAMLHDIGELNIRRMLLDKPASLDEAERVAMCDHTIVGARWLGGVPGLAALVPFARWHHERFDGLGYPDGCGGQDVPLGVALVGVCDAWDALTEARPYRAPLSLDEAIIELRRHGERQWSRALVEWTIECVTSTTELPPAELPPTETTPNEVAPD